MKCRSCSRCALYQEPGFTGVERCFCTRKGRFAKGCKRGRRGKPKRMMLDACAMVGDPAVWGYHDS